MGDLLSSICGTDEESEEEENNTTDDGSDEEENGTTGDKPDKGSDEGENDTTGDKPDKGSDEGENDTSNGGCWGSLKGLLKDCMKKKENKTTPTKEEKQVEDRGAEFKTSHCQHFKIEMSQTLEFAENGTLSKCDSKATSCFQTNPRQ